MKKLVQNLQNKFGYLKNILYLCKKNKMEQGDISELLWNEGFSVGRMISDSKSGYRDSFPKNIAVFNANIVTVTHGKVWYGDLDITRDGAKLKEIAKKAGEPFFILREMDARFGTEKDSASTLIKKAVWNTSEEIPENNNVK